ncbi:MAG: hypothetical protein KDA49_00740, partial [Rhodospirillaceae bacterium]|nr:hypothetical protein [Rhodospirillaceae bacterium]
QVELLRRVAHWLMREPSLEENLLTASADGHTLRISRRLLEGDPAGPVEVTGPDEDITTVTLEAAGPGLAEAAVRVSQPGIYQVTDGERQALAVVGDLSSPEFTQVHATAERLAQVVAASGGGTVWLEDGVPDLRRVHPGRDTAGADWLGLVDRQNYQVTGARQTPLLPPWVAVLLILPPLILAWRAEGR